ncbi:DUF3000 domain-containing protein [Yinghuangia sp. ASG 101]|uniref:DUF3000 domain-containing protein n=1 Tax=Yinghuangia sp. ASG 101 TaxID=2896848 RepID=UPI001E2E8570|nr:DUF3000 domain-containing protein [Yinghuangia sp. ASG 101]UGQ13788.1 DUF3000 domain-containing protein [Yinghuangia sp. ASG 101]
MSAVGETEEPAEFRRAVERMRAAALRPEIELTDMPRPRNLAPFSTAFSAEVVVEDEELGGGRIVLLHDPGGHEAWEGTFRLVTMSRAELEPEMATDPLLPEVGWTWLTEALHMHGATYAAPSGTVTRATSQGFGGLQGQIARTEIEIRASWTPAGDDLAPHMQAWLDLLCTCAGLPPLPPVNRRGGGDGGVVPMPSRSTPRGR